MTTTPSHNPSDSANTPSSLNTVPLPDTMTELLATAIADARSLDPAAYHPYSSVWHAPDEEGPCRVCLAGSLIAGTFQAPLTQSLSPYVFDERDSRKLVSINYMRSGHWVLAFSSFYRGWPSRSIESQLASLPTPSNPDFIGWHAFRIHLDSLETILPQLRKIEDDFRAL